VRRPGLLFFLSLLVGIGACAAQRPVLYPDAALERSGPKQAQEDIDECMRRADAYVSSGAAKRRTAERTARHAGTGTVIGAAGGAVGGAVVGHPGRGAAAGAAGGFTGGLLHGLFASRKPDPTYRHFVDRCLRERGYHPIGWQ
jgi:uncharacterized protein YcfJ